MQTTKRERGVDILGGILAKSRVLTKELSGGPSRGERAGPDSTMASLYRPPTSRHVHGAHCANCFTLDERMIEVDLKFGVRICKNCGAVDSTPIRTTTEEDSRAFDGDPVCHMRTEYRCDGLMGSFIAVKYTRPGVLEPPAVSALQRAQKRLCTAAVVPVKCDGESGSGSGATTERDTERLSAAITTLAEQMQCCAAMRDDAVRMAKSWLSKRAAHALACTCPKTCALANMTIPQPIEGFAALFIQRASSRTAEGVGAALAIQHFTERFNNPTKASRVMHASIAMLDMLAYDPRVGCDAKHVALDTHCAKPAQATDGSKGIAARAIAAMKLGFSLETRVFEMLDWMCDVSLLVSRQPATVVATAIYLTMIDMNPTSLPSLALICNAVGAVMVETARKAITIVKASPHFAKRAVA